MKTITLLLAFLLTGTWAIAQPATIDTVVAKKNVKAAAEKMGQYFVHKNYTAYINYMHPRIIQMAGGNAKMIAIIKSSIKQMEDQGIWFTGSVIGEPSKITVTATALQTVIPQTMEMKMTNGKMVAKAYLLAVSANSGKSWYFIDTSDKTLAQLQEVIPGLSNNLVIPVKEKPVLYKN